MSIPNPDPQAYSWIRSAINEPLENVVGALDTAINKNDHMLVRDAHKNLHQIQGSLQMVELDAASILATECEALIEEILRSQDADKIPGALLVTRQCVEVLVNYLDSISARQASSPLTLVEYINKARKALNKAEITPFELFNPSFTWHTDQKSSARKMDRVVYLKLVRDLEARFRDALLNWLTGDNKDSSLDGMSRMMQHLYKVSDITILKELWWVASGLIDAVLSGDITDDPEIKSLFAKLDAEMRRMKAQDQSTILRSPPDELIRKMLFHIGQIRNEQSKQVKEIKNIVGLRRWFDLKIYSKDKDEFSNLKEQIRQYVETIADEDLETLESVLDDYFSQNQNDPDLLRDAQSISSHLIEKATNYDLNVIKDMLVEIKNALELLMKEPALKDNAEVRMDFKLASAVLSVRDSLFANVPLTSQWKKDIINSIESLKQVTSSASERPTDRISSTADHADALEALCKELDQEVVEVEQQFDIYKQGVNVRGSSLGNDLVSHFNRIASYFNIVEWDETAHLAKSTSEWIESRFKIQEPLTDEEEETIAFSIATLGISVGRIEWEQGEDRGLVKNALEKIARIPKLRVDDEDDVSDKRRIDDPLIEDRMIQKQQEIQQIQLHEIFFDEMKEHIEVLEKHLLSEEPVSREGRDEIGRTLHTMIGNCRNMDYEILAITTVSLQKLIKKPGQLVNLIENGRASIIIPFIILFKESMDDISVSKNIDSRRAEKLQHLNDTIQNAADKQQIQKEQGEDTQIDSIDSSDVRNLGADNPSMEKFVIESKEILARISKSLSALHQSGMDKIFIDELSHDFHALKDSASDSDQHEISNLCDSVEKVLQSYSDHDVTNLTGLLNLLEETFDVVSSRIGLIPSTADDSLQAMQKMVDTLLDDKSIKQPQSNSKIIADEGTREEIKPAAKFTEKSNKRIIKKRIIEQKSYANSGEIVKLLENLKDRTETIDQELFVIFREEGEEILRRIDNNLKKWRKSGNVEEGIQSIRRGFHTLKGSAAACGFKTISELAHYIESMLEAPDRNQVDLINYLEQAHDGIAARLGIIPSIGNQPRQVVNVRVKGSAADQLPKQKTHTSGNASTNLPDESPNGLSDDTKGHLQSSPFRQTTTSIDMQLQAEVDGSLRIPSSHLANLVNTSGEMGMVRSQLYTAIDSTKNMLESMRSGMVDLRNDLRELEIQAASQIISTPEIVDEKRVGVEEFDPLQMDRYSELHSKTRDATDRLEHLVQIENQLAEQALALDNALTHDEQLGSMMQTSLMSARMVSIDSYEFKLRHLVRETARRMDKSAQFVLQGGEIEVDRMVIEAMMPPLEHMIRNALSHGIEYPEKRKQLGKPSTGKILLKITQIGAEIVMTFSDDGQGIDINKVRSVAEKRKLIEPGSEIEDEHLLQIITQAGVTTIETVNMDAGRGIGMDVVIQEVQRLGGMMEMENKPGKGIKFSFRLPASLVATKALLVNIGGIRFGVNTRIVDRVVTILRNEVIIDDDGISLVSINDNQYPLISLAPKMGLHTDSDRKDLLRVLLVRFVDRMAAIEVDEFYEIVDIVSKQPGVQLESIPGISGGAILADSSIVLILDPVAFIDRSVMKYYTDAGNQHSKRISKILVVDDSTTVRKIMKRDLESLSMHVTTAVDGQDALYKLAEGIFDVALIDIEMPKMNGYELLLNIRGRKEYQDMPVIFVTSRSGEQHKKKAISMGVDEYVTKPYTIDILEHVVQKVLKSKGTLH